MWKMRLMTRIQKRLQKCIHIYPPCPLPTPSWFGRDRQGENQKCLPRVPPSPTSFFPFFSLPCGGKLPFRFSYTLSLLFVNMCAIRSTFIIHIACVYNLIKFQLTTLRYVKGLIVAMVTVIIRVFSIMGSLCAEGIKTFEHP